MDFILETGQGIPGATAYIDEDYLWAYAPYAAVELGSGDPKACIVRGSAWIDVEFEARFPGCRVKSRGQGLAWPRAGAYDVRGDLIPSDELPVEIKRATAEAALRDMVTPGVLLPDVATGGMVKREKLGSMEREYAVADGGRPAAPSFPLIEGILRPLIGGYGSGTVRLVRA